MRRPVVAGTFYPADPEELEKIIEDLFIQTGEIPKASEKLIPPVGLISPHAGYIYSGKTAAFGYKEIAKMGKPNTVFIIGPDHTGYANPISISYEEAWFTPFGVVEVDRDIVNELLERSDLIKINDFPHQFEHSLEVQIPFLQYLYESYFKIVPMMMGNQSSKIAKILANILLNYKKPGNLFIASTDLNHYENHEVTLKKGEKIIEAISNLDVELLYKNLVEYGISMCGYGPVAVLLNMNFKRSKILYHTTSAERSKDYTQTVGYLSAILTD